MLIYKCVVEIEDSKIRIYIYLTSFCVRDEIPNIQTHTHTPTYVFIL